MALPGLSIVELLVAIAILSVISVTTIRLISSSDSQLLRSHIERKAQQADEAIATFIYEDFQSGSLLESTTPQSYVNASMPQDLRSANPLTMATLLGNGNRYDGLTPLCALLSDTNQSSPTFTFAANCVMRGTKPIAELMNELIAKGVKLTLAIESGAARCTISAPIQIAAATQVATATVEDPKCLLTSDSPPTSVKRGSHVLLPRFVIHNASDPQSFHASLIEPPGKNAPAIGLDMPPTKAVIGGGFVNDIAIIDATATVPRTPVSISIEVENPMSRLALKTLPNGVIASGLGSRRIVLKGLIENIRTALAGLMYQSPAGFFGKDGLRSLMMAEPLRRTKRTTLDVIANCGNQTCGTATRFDLGTFDSASGKFTTHQYLTTTSVCSNDYPTTYYGYCGRAVKYDRTDGLKNPATAGQCALAADPVLQALQSYAPAYQPPVTGVQHFPYVLFSPKARNQRPDSITVFVHEQMALKTRDRYTLFFNFDTFDATGGTVEFTLNNIEKDRDLDDRNDPFTLMDDPGEYTPRVMDANGVLTAAPSWQLPNDGVIVPLRLPASAQPSPKTGLFELKDYWQDPDGDNNTNPNLVLDSWQGLDSWNIRAVEADLTTVSYQRIPFDANSAKPKTAIQLVIDGSQRCSSTRLTP